MLRGLLLSLFVGIFLPCTFATANQNDKKLTISGTYTYKELFSIILQQTGKQVSYAHNTINDQEKVKIDLKEATIDEVLNLALRGKNIRWILSDNYISLSANKSTNPDSKITAPADTIPQHTVSGLVTDTFGIPLPGATVLVRGTSQGTATDSNGRFTLRNIKPTALLEIGYTGYEKRITAVEGRSEITLVLLPTVTELSNVEVYSTGYQNLPKERATGSFVQIDNELLNRRVGTKILDRLEGVTSGLIFNKNLQGGGRNESIISIRGRSTIFSNPAPLIILDNFPYDGDLANLNPNDIENISILRDAAAASIWGAYSGNGVIVITTKKGAANQTPTVSFNSNLTLYTKPNIYYNPQMSIDDYINFEKYLFDKGAYDFTINSTTPYYLSPAIDIFLKESRNEITSDEATNRIRQLKLQDVRTDINRQLYKTQADQQYALNIKGGGKRNQYFISLGVDNNDLYQKNNTFKRFTITANNNYHLINDKVQLNVGLILAKSESRGTNEFFSTIPYDKLIDASGKHLSIGGGALRQSYIDTAGKGYLLDWNYKPLDEINYVENKSLLLDYRLNTGLKVRLTSYIDINVLYQYSRGTNETSRHYSAESFHTRHLINQFSQINYTNGTIKRVIPIGAILDYGTSNYESHNLRGQLNLTKKVANNHFLSTLLGAEVRTTSRLNVFHDPLYGYNKDLGTSASVSFLLDYPVYYDPFLTAKIPNSYLGKYRLNSIDNNRSFFGNIGYTFKDRYTFTVSARKDQSNIFGVEANQKGIPLWSVGVGWDISQEVFYDISWMPFLKMRLTNGYNGNVNKTVSAYTTARSLSPNLYNQPSLSITNPPNRELKWEQVQIINGAIDFGLQSNILSGSIEYYIKKGKDLIGDAPYDPTAGFSVFRGNVADIKGSGWDLRFNLNNLGTKFKWSSSIQISYALDKVTNYKVKESTISAYLSPVYTTPLEGFPMYSLFSLKYGGLDNNGNPQGYIEDKLSTEYVSILGSNDLSTLQYNGPINPPFFGNFRNDFSYGQFDFSFNLVAKFGHYFRRHSLDYGTLLNVGFGTNPLVHNPDFDSRWQVPGDEKFTKVPSLEYPNNTLRNGMYNYSDLLVESASHIRLQDFRVSFKIKDSFERKIFQSARLYAYVNNLGVIWKMTKFDIDPDAIPNQNSGYSIYPNPRTYSFGIEFSLK